MGCQLKTGILRSAFPPTSQVARFVGVRLIPKIMFLVSIYIKTRYATGALHLMNTVCENDIVIWNSGRPEPKTWVQCKLMAIKNTQNPAHPAPPLYYLRTLKLEPDIGHEFWCNATEVKPANGFCPVCKQEVGLDNKVIKKHNVESRLCYGSYMPGS